MTKYIIDIMVGFDSIKLIESLMKIFGQYLPNQSL